MKRSSARATCAVWYWGTGSGGARVAVRLLNRLTFAYGAGSVVALLHRHNPWFASAEAKGLDLHTVGGAAGYGSKFALLLAAPWRALHLLVVLLRHRPGVVVVPMNFALACPLALIPRMLGIKMIYIVHDAEPHPGDYAQTWQRLTQRWLVLRSSHVVAMSDVVASRLLELHPGLSPERLDVLPLHRLAPALKSPIRGKRDGPVRFLFLGRLLPYKGLDLMAAAFASLADRMDWRLTIAGDGPERDTVLELFGKMCQVDLTKLHAFEDDAIETLIASHDVMICPYREASQSGSVAEALYGAMPSLVTPAGGLPEQIGFGRAGWISTAISSDALATAIRRCLDEHDLYAERSADVVLFAQEQLSHNAWPIIIDRTLSSTPDG